MTYAPKTLIGLADYFEEHGGVNLGIVGDAAHTKGYHLGRDRLTLPDYSVKQPRDVAGLTNAASAIDLGRIHGSLQELYAFSRELVAACMAKAPGYRDVREVIYSPDGRRVQRWSGVSGQIETGPGNGDASHLTHTHVSYFRDSEAREKVGLFAPLMEGDMPAIVWYPVAGGDGTVTLKAGRGLVDLITGRRYVPTDTEKISHARAVAEGVGSGFLVRDSGHACLALDDACTFTPASTAALRRFVITADADPNTITVTQDGIPVE